MIKVYKWLNKNLDYIVLSLSTAASVGSLIYYISLNLHFAYNDATSHLNISRRVVDSLTPGIVQIGSTWLPMLHILELPFIWNDFMWQSGLAGAIISMICFVASSVFINKSLLILTMDKISALIGVVIFISNANMLYMQTTAMFEPLLIVTALGGFYFLLRWVHSRNISHLISSAFFVMMGTLTRYDGWFLLIASSLFIFIFSFKKLYGKVQGITILFFTLASYGIVMWLIYNYAIFGSPFYFAFNEYSAHAQQTRLAERGELPTKNNIQLSILFYLTAVALNEGVILSFLALIGIIYYFIKNRFQIETWVVYILLVPCVFNIFALFKGHSVIWVPLYPPYFNTFFNIRYGLLLLPAVAIFVGYLTKNSVTMKSIIVICILVQLALFYSLLPNRDFHLSFVTLKDTVASINEGTRDATNWLAKHYDGGLILISSASSESFIFNTGLKLKN